jgi:nitrite reductase/ring-hydroxylating ferredoxin subunit
MEAAVESRSGGVRPDFIPEADYTARDLLARERSRLWPRVWQIACREEEIPEVGDYLNYEILDESILLVRVAADEIKAFYNVCQHRGRRLIDNRCGNVARTGFHCGFHGWRYGLNGNLAYVHDRKDWANCPDFDPKQLSLKEPRVGCWGGWVWINMDRDAEPLLDYLGEFTKVLANFELEKLRFPLLRIDHRACQLESRRRGFQRGLPRGRDAHRPDRLLDDAFADRRARPPHDVLHAVRHDAAGAQERPMGQPRNVARVPVPAVARVARQVARDGARPGHARGERVRAECPPDATLEQVVIAYFRFQREELEKTGAEWPEKLTLEEVFKAGTGWHIFPNTIMLPTVNGVLWYRMRPYGSNPDQCIFDIWCLERVPKGAPYRKIQPRVWQGFDAFRGNNPFLEQDFGNMVAVNEGMKSRGWEGARTNPVQELAISNFHAALRQYVGG